MRLRWWSFLALLCVTGCGGGRAFQPGGGVESEQPLLSRALESSDDAMKLSRKPGAAVNFKTIARGNYSCISERREVVIRNEPAWQALWNEHTACRDAFLPLPDVNFKRDMVIAVFTGVQQCGNFSTDVGSVRRLDNGTLRVNVVTHGGGACLDQPARWFHIIRLKRSDAPVQFKHRTTCKLCP